MHSGIVIAIGKHVVAEQALTGRGKSIGIDESTDLGVVISALQIIQFGFSYVSLAVGAKIGCFWVLWRGRF